MRGGFNAYLTQRVTRSLGFDATKLALPARMNTVQQLQAFPRFDMSDMTSIGSDTGDQLIQSNKSFGYSASVTWIRGAHNWKFGSDNRVYQSNNTQGARAAAFSFTAASPRVQIRTRPAQHRAMATHLSCWALRHPAV